MRFHLSIFILQELILMAINMILPVITQRHVPKIHVKMVACVSSSLKLIIAAYAQLDGQVIIYFNMLCEQHYRNFLGQNCSMNFQASNCSLCMSYVTGITETTTPRPSICQNNGKNLCNYGSCSVSSRVKQGYICFCMPGVTGKFLKKYFSRLIFY